MTDTVELGGENFTAFESRLVITCNRRSASSEGWTTANTLERMNAVMACPVASAPNSTVLCVELSTVCRVLL